jgi:hypothetical protein
MFATEPVSRAALGEDLHELWACLDALLDRPQAIEWSARIGGMSSVAPQAVPSHLAWFDEQLVLGTIRRGPDVPETQRRTISTLAELERWDTGAAASVTLEHDALAMHAAPEKIRRLLAEARDEADLDRPIWWPLPLSGGWRTTRLAAFRRLFPRPPRHRVLRPVRPGNRLDAS